MIKPLLFGLACALATLAFIYLGGEVMEGDTGGFDNRLLRIARAVRSGRPPPVGVLQDLSALGSATVLTVGALLASTRSRTQERADVLGIAALMTLLLGGSRVALGVHWATDVAGGWALGAAWALA